MNVNDLSSGPGLLPLLLRRGLEQPFQFAPGIALVLPTGPLGQLNGFFNETQGISPLATSAGGGVSLPTLQPAGQPL
jgi:hypothetical protein